MSFEITATPQFGKSLKALAKRYASIRTDFAAFAASLSENPNQGDELSPGIRKIRMAIKSKGRGKSAGARVITYTVYISPETGVVYLIDIYDKSDYSTVDVEIVKQIISEIETDKQI